MNKHINNVVKRIQIQLIILICKNTSWNTESEIIILPFTEKKSLESMVRKKH